MIENDISITMILGCLFFAGVFVGLLIGLIIWLL